MRIKLIATVLIFSFLTASVLSFVNLTVVRSESNSDVDIDVTYEVQEFIPLPTLQNKIVNLKSQKQAELLEKEYNDKVARAEAILRKYNSPFAGLGHIIVKKTDECGGDYRVLLGIAGNESGFGRIPYKQYNPFGYLNGVTYSGWEESLAVLSCKIAQQYLVPCNSKPECIVVRYAGPSDDKEKWVRNIYFFANQI